jgi:hypothetical protein
VKVTLKKAPHGATRVRVQDVVLRVGKEVEVSDEVHRALVAMKGVHIEVSKPGAATDESVRGGVANG